ncbi:hypothetical protein Ciccas_011163 [Cichlidogyrus casuarinus]|uniref:Uncharacterized protein n=1 Tax=Cichlidogyrus casuarinus TaxID=1844966 RepID=A0ABD2PS31_9PLAT
MLRKVGERAWGLEPQDNLKRLLQKAENGSKDANENKVSKWLDMNKDYWYTKPITNLPSSLLRMGHLTENLIESTDTETNDDTSCSGRNSI